MNSFVLLLLVWFCVMFVCFAGCCAMVGCLFFVFVCMISACVLFYYINVFVRLVCDLMCVMMCVCARVFVCGVCGFFV